MPVFTELAVGAAEWAKSLNADGGANLRKFGSDVKDVTEGLGTLLSVMRAVANAAGGVKDVAGIGTSPLGKKATDQNALDFDAFLRSHGVGTDLAHALSGAAPVIAANQKAAMQAAAEQAAASLQADNAASGGYKSQVPAQVTAVKQLKELADAIAAGDREKAVIQQAITLATRENLDLKKSEAELQLELLPLKAQQADIDEKLLIMADKRGAMERDAAVTRAQMAPNASADALEGATFEERRLKLKIQADALGGRGVAAGDLAELKSLAFARPGLELNALLGGRGATLAERDRTRAQQAQDLATLPLREQKAALDEQMAGLSAQSADIQRQIEEARLHGVIDTTGLEKQKRALDDALFAANKRKADMEGKGVSITQTFSFTSTGEIDYQKVVDMTFKATFDALKTVQTNQNLPAPVGLPGSRTAGVTGPY